MLRTQSNVQLNLYFEFEPSYPRKKKKKKKVDCGIIWPNPESNGCPLQRASTNIVRRGAPALLDLSMVVFTFIVPVIFVP
jgi:hypothetical protein